MILLGQAALLVTLVAALWSVAAGALGATLDSPSFAKSAGRGLVASFVLLALAMGGLAYALLTNDFNVVYVSDYSSIHQPLAYKISALWAGQGGSLMFWAFTLAAFGAATVAGCRRRPELAKMLPWAYVVIAATLFFFTAVTAFVANPFERYPGGMAPPDGTGLNPLLQNFWMMIHPPTLYLGYVGCTVPFAFALAALFTGQLDNTWVRAMRRWTLFAFALLSLGIWLGGYWAYIELGWGGFWAWDAVENASLMPWLVLTAFVHSIVIQERRGMLKVWNIVLITVTFLLTVYGTFLTRSGIIQSVHAFNKSSIGNWFLAFLAITALVTCVALFRRLGALRPDAPLDSMLSRESSFLWGNLLLLGLTAMVFFLTMYPVLSPLWSGHQITPEPMQFTRATRPAFLALIVLMGFSPLAAWRRTEGRQLLRSAAVPAAIAFGVTALLAILGAREPWSLAFFASVLFVGSVVVIDIVRLLRRSEDGTLSFAGRVLHYRRRLGGYVSHFSVVLMVIGIAGSMAYKTDEKFESLTAGRSVTVDGYRLTYVGFDVTDTPTFDGAIVKVAVESPGGGRSLLLLPEMRRYGKNRPAEERQPATEVAILSTLVPSSARDVRRIGEDLYVIPLAVDLARNEASIEVLVHPMVNWLWFGGVLLLFGTLVAYWPGSREPATVAAHEPVRAGAPATETP